MGLKLTNCKRPGCNDQFHYCASCDFNEIYSLGYCSKVCMRKNRDAFEKAYAERSGVTVEWLHQQGQFAAPCDCGETGCKDWKMENKEDFDGEN